MKNNMELLNSIKKDITNWQLQEFGSLEEVGSANRYTLVDSDLEHNETYYSVTVVLDIDNMVVSTKIDEVITDFKHFKDLNELKQFTSSLNYDDLVAVDFDEFLGD